MTLLASIAARIWATAAYLSWLVPGILGCMGSVTRHGLQSVAAMPLRFWLLWALGWGVGPNRSNQAAVDRRGSHVFARGEIEVGGY